MKISKCIDCGKEKQIHAFGKCYHCYRRSYKQPQITCKICGELKEHHSRGMCKNCAQKLFYYDQIKAHNIKKLYKIDLELWKEVTKKCFLCGFDKIVDMHHIDHNRQNNSRSNLIGLCPNHHKMAHDMRFREEIDMQIEDKLVKNHLYT